MSFRWRVLSKYLTLGAILVSCGCSSGSDCRNAGTLSLPAQTFDADGLGVVRGSGQVGDTVILGDREFTLTLTAVVRNAGACTTPTCYALVKLDQGNRVAILVLLQESSLFDYMIDYTDGTATLLSGLRVDLPEYPQNCPPPDTERNPWVGIVFDTVTGEVVRSQCVGCA